MTRTQEPIHLRLPNGETLRGDLQYTQAPNAEAVVFVHGFASSRQGEKSAAFEAACAQRDGTFATFDFRGHGESDGSMRDLRPSRLLEDLGAVRDWLLTRGVRRLFLVGSSMGAFVASWFALDCAEVASCVFIAPAFRFLERRWEALTDAQREHWRSAGFVRHRNEWIDVEVGYGLAEERNSYPFHALAERWAKPALIFHGWNDETVPASDSVEFLQRVPATNVELRLFKQGDHRLIAFKDEMAAEACRFFSFLTSPLAASRVQKKCITPQLKSQSV